MTGRAPMFEPIAFADIAGWADDDHAGALRALVRGAPSLDVTSGAGAPGISHDLRRVGLAAHDLGPEPGSAAARHVFETHFTPHRVVHQGEPGLVTGYFEPEVDGSLTPSDAFPAPLYRRPADLINLVEESARGAAGDRLTHARTTPAGPVPFATRAEIDAGCLAPQGLELAYLADAVEAFMMQVQGSGLIRLADGTSLRVGYDGKNGHPYTSIGGSLIADGSMAAADMSLAGLVAWLRADPARARSIMQRNASFVFFRALAGADGEGPLGVHGIPLTPGRSLAVDTRFHAIGTPVFVTSPALPDPERGGPFRRLMIAQDVGSAIRGPERGDIFFGTGAGAGALAGVTKHACRFVVLLPGGAAPP